MFEIDLFLPARVVVDPNSASRRDPDLVLARIEDADREVQEGDFVIAVEPDDDGGPDFVGSACVSHVDAAHGLIYLHVDWASFAEDASGEIDMRDSGVRVHVHGSVRTEYRPTVAARVVNGSGVRGRLQPA